MEKVRIQDDLYTYVNQKKLEELVIPDDMPSAGGFMELNKDVEKIMMKEFEDMCASNSYPNEYLRRACVLYKAAMNAEKKEADGAAPALKTLEMVKGLEDISAFNKAFKDLILAGITQLITVVLADKIKHHEYIRSLKPLIA